MLSHGKSYAFTKKGTQKAIFLRPLTVFYVCFSLGLHFFVDKIRRAKSPKCPIQRQNRNG